MKTTYLLLAALAFAGSALAKGSSADRDFATQAARDGAGEVALGRLAVSQGRSQAVKTFGQHMVDDHTKAGDELKAAARQDHIDLPSEAQSERPGTDSIASLRGAEFDHAYARKMVEDHEKAVALFRHETQSAGDSHVKTFARKTLPTLEQHLRMARELQTQTATNGKADAGKP
ncbi:DUF4142 domain-containing protein [Dokdonella sp.]|uniref:DUF4142 domain-containing protein n=1 Tax=Dokdonella sp. TaxID=2291710 RepID=UPI001B2B96E0|nr:DUF4142 domain-containing protein [Dokdonella sp.]MBO9662860.1 DUF4142 domain-containing protein [Dokdonella sp.]